MGTVMAAAVIVVVVFATLLGGLWLVLRSPQMARELKAERAENERLRAVLERLREAAVGYADVNPVAQVFLDGIARAGTAPARRKEK